MLRTQITLALAVLLGCSRAPAQYRTVEVPPLTAAMRSHLQAERFQLITSIRGLPLGVRDHLQTLFGTGLDIAEPGEPFQQSGVTMNSSVPIRRLVAAGCAGDHHCLVYYERGGATVTSRVALFKWTPAETRFDWGATAPAGFATIEDVRKAVASGAIKAPGAPW